MWKYSDKVMDHYRNPRNVGSIKDADVIGEAGSLACGDSLKLYLKIKDNIVTDAKFQTFGCGSAVASSSILTEMVIGKTLDEVRKITNQDIA
ncbi:iron-sulfur cluster assembly scaffold protein, partial [bacterium]|nr:iron-sulfur cluster assembly scaffold protein [bacterium]